MNTTELSKTLRESARQNGLCDEWYNEWEDDSSAETLAAKMYKGLDFCILHHWPSNDFIKENFSQDFRHKVNVYVDDRHSALNPRQTLILGKSDITIRYNAANHGEVYIRDNSIVKLTAKNRSFVIVHLYEKACISTEQKDSAKIVMIKHSHDVTITHESSGDIKEEYDYLK